MRKDEQALSKKQADAEITNVLVDDLDKFEFWAIKEWKKIFAVCVIFILLVTSIAFYISSINKAKARVLSEFNNAKTIEIIVSTISKYPSNIAVTQAKLTLAKLYTNEKKYDLALDQYNEILKQENISDDIYDKVKINIPYLLEIKKDIKTAINEFKSVGTDPRISTTVRAEANYMAGRLLIETKDNNTAKQVLELVVNNQNKDQNAKIWEVQAQALLNKL